MRCTIGLGALCVLVGGCESEATESACCTPYDSGEDWTPPHVDSDESGQTDTHDSVPHDSDTSPPDSGDPCEQLDSGCDSGDTGEAPKGPAVILFIGDGMGFEHVEGGGMYVNGSAGSLQMETLPFQGRIQTASLSGITDSAASATAMATGSKTFNGRLGLDRDGTTVESVLEKARSRGMSVGVVTTDTLTGATPSAFVVHIEDRGDGGAIANEYLSDLPDLALGGGYVDFEGGLSSVSANVVTTAAELAAATPDGRPLLGLFAETEFPFVAQGYDADQPTLADMTEAAIAWLDADPDGFFLMVEGARIDHASHGNDENSVFDEVASFDDAIGTAISWSGGRDATIIVTADHECGGLSVSGTGSPGVVPDSEWRWGRHTNADVPVFATGTLTPLFDGARLDDLWINAVLEASVEGASAVTSPSVPVLPDGDTDDLGAAVTTQVNATTFGAGYNQLDGLHVYADDLDGLHIGIDGVFERGANSPIVWIDLDYGDGTGISASGGLSDYAGGLDNMMSDASFENNVSGLGFEVAVGAIGAEECESGFLYDYTGLRGLYGDWGSESNLSWLEMISNYDDGNVAEGAAARDAGATGLTENGVEIVIPWDQLYSTGIPGAGATLAVWVELVNEVGDYASNQALPPFSAADEPAGDAAPIDSVVAFSIDASGNLVGAPAVSP